MAEIQFIDGLRTFKPRNALSFVIANCKVKVSDLIKFMVTHSKDDELAFVIKESKSGSFYATLDTYEKKVPLTQEELDTIESARKQDTQKLVGNLNEIPF